MIDNTKQYNHQKIKITKKEQQPNMETKWSMVSCGLHMETCCKSA